METIVVLIIMYGITDCCSWIEISDLYSIYKYSKFIFNNLYSILIFLKNSIK